jgi:hypothetical protein
MTIVQIQGKKNINSRENIGKLSSWAKLSLLSHLYEIAILMILCLKPGTVDPLRATHFPLSSTSQFFSAIFISCLTP